MQSRDREETQVVYTSSQKTIATYSSSRTDRFSHSIIED